MTAHKKFKIGLSIFGLICGITSCSSSTDQEFKIEKGRLQVVDSVVIQDENFQFGRIFSPKIFNDTILGFGDGTFTSINLFNAKTGAYITNFETDSIDSYVIPQKDYSHFTISGDSVFILNDLVNKLYVFTLKKDFINVIDLKFKNERFKSFFLGTFEKINNKFFLTPDFMGVSMNETFLNAPLISVFDFEGNHLYDFGRYPETYHEGKLVLSNYTSSIINGDKMYIINAAGKLVLEEYSLDGNLTQSYNLLSDHFDPTIGFYTDDPFEAPLTDQVNGLSTDQNADDKTFYITYTSFDTRDREFGLKTFRWMLMKVDLENKSIKEFELADNWYIDELTELVAQVKNDTVSILIREPDEKLYLKRLIFD